ncbi:MAG: hypothetical protein OXB92_09545 [Acidimicrobiaceae bacterium]|nr:hypothetical protein [Acidimicrobiaceae bacterium]
MRFKKPALGGPVWAVSGGRAELLPRQRGRISAVLVMGCKLGVFVGTVSR